MASQLSTSCRPIFVVGSPRSGTSILTWALGQHSNILVQEESSWMGPLALHLELAYLTGTERGSRSQLSALGVGRDDFFTAFGDAINNLIINHRQKLETQAALEQAPPPPVEPRPELEPPPLAVPGFEIARSVSDPKLRWIDGTPEYSFYIYPLRMLFPQARFIHVVRDVSSVVPSMLNFERTGGPPLVQTEEEAYQYWLRTVRGCYAAEMAFGSEVVYRLRHSDLGARPEESLKSLLEFLGEPFEPACLEPLRLRINSSQVPATFDPADPKTNRSLVAEANQLSAEIMQPSGPLAPDPETAAELEDLFLERVTDLASVKVHNRIHVKRIAELEAALARAEHREQS